MPNKQPFNDGFIPNTRETQSANNFQWERKRQEYIISAIGDFFENENNYQTIIHNIDMDDFVLYETIKGITKILNSENASNPDNVTHSQEDVLAKLESEYSELSIIGELMIHFGLIDEYKKGIERGNFNQEEKQNLIKKIKEKITKK